MNKLAKYKGVLTVLVPLREQEGVTSYYTFPITEYNVHIPEYVDSNDKNIELISIAKLHFSEARNIIKAFVNDYELVPEVVTESVNVNNVVNQPSLASKGGVLLHAMYDREY